MEGSVGSAERPLICAARISAVTWLTPLGPGWINEDRSKIEPGAATLRVTSSDVCGRSAMAVNRMSYRPV